MPPAGVILSDASVAAIAKGISRQLTADEEGAFKGLLDVQRALQGKFDELVNLVKAQRRELGSLRDEVANLRLTGGEDAVEGASGVAKARAIYEGEGTNPPFVLSLSPLKLEQLQVLVSSQKKGLVKGLTKLYVKWLVAKAAQPPLEEVALWLVRCAAVWKKVDSAAFIAESAGGFSQVRASASSLLGQQQTKSNAQKLLNGLLSELRSSMVGTVKKIFEEQWWPNAAVAHNPATAIKRELQSLLAPVAREGEDDEDDGGLFQVNQAMFDDFDRAHPSFPSTKLLQAAEDFFEAYGMDQNVAADHPEWFINGLAFVTLLIGGAKVQRDMRKADSMDALVLSANLPVMVIGRMAEAKNWFACPLRCPSLDKTIMSYQQKHNYQPFTQAAAAGVGTRRRQAAEGLDEMDVEPDAS